MSREDDQTYAALREELRAEAAGEVEGLFGPGSMAWRILRELCIAFGGGRALLLQLAHPAVSTAVRHHSGYQADLLGRTLRTFESVYRVVFSDLPTALAVADRVHARHRSVRGVIDSGPPNVPYRALDPELLFWVHATLIDTTYAVYEMLVRPLDAREQEAFYAESQRFALAFGIPRAVMPKGFSGFREYMTRMLEGGSLRVSDAERSLREQLIAAPNMSHFFSGLLMADDPKPAQALFSLPGLSTATRAMFEVATAAMLPERLARDYGLKFGLRERAEMAAVVRALKSAVALTPGAVRYVPIYHQAKARIADAAGHQQPVDSVMQRWLWSVARLGAARWPSRA